MKSKEMIMRVSLSVSILCALALSIGQFAGVKAKDQQERPRCGECGMFSDSSSTRIKADLSAKGKSSQREFCCVACLDAVLSADSTDTKLSRMQILDYSSFGSKSPTMIDGLAAFYLYGTKPLRGSMLPPVAAFASKKDAEAAKAQLGGDLLAGWSEVRKRLAKERSDEADS
jgi:nitrous oxide reductase accessory protein NosL